MFRLEMEAMDSSVEDTTLLWSMAEMKDLFVAQRMWPSFVGAKETTQSSYNAHVKATNIVDDYKLPVLLWPEQKRYLDKKLGGNYGVDKPNQSQGKEAVKRSEQKNDGSNSKSEGKKKRKRSDEEDQEDKKESNDKVGEPNNKKARREGGFLAGLASFFGNAFSSVAKLMVPRKPLSNAEAQVAIFSSCQDMGYFIGPGHVYGGDYNIYRGGDPSNSHSTATVRVVRRPTISGRDLLSFSRVQNQVAKSAVLAFVDPASNEPKFLVANFQNVSERL